MFEERRNAKRTAQRMLFEALTSKPSKVLGLAGDCLVNALMEDDGLIVFVEEKVENVDFNISDTKNGLKLLKEKYQ